MEERKKLKVFISGPMSNLPDWNFPAFHAMADRLHAAGYQVVNPSELYEAMDQVPTEWVDSMRFAIKILVDCDAIVMLPGWQQSKGATIEAAIARSLGFKVLDSESLEEVLITHLPVILA